MTLTPDVPPVYPQGMRKGFDQGVSLDGEVSSGIGQVTPDLSPNEGARIARAKREATSNRKRLAWARRIAAMNEDERKAEKARQGAASRQAWARRRAAKLEDQRIAERQEQARAAMNEDERKAALAQEATAATERRRQYAAKRRTARTVSQKAAEAAKDHLRYLARKQARQAGGTA